MDYDASMGEIKFEANGEPGNNHDYKTALNLAKAAVTISNSLVVLYFVAIQYFLLKTRASRSKIKPTNIETNVGVAALWVLHQILDIILGTSIDTIVQTVCGSKIALGYRNFRYVEGSNVRNWALAATAWTWRGSFNLIFWECMISWAISMSISLVPRAREVHKNPSKALTQLKRRYLELVKFAGILFQGAENPSFKSGSISIKSVRDDWKTNGPNIGLRRRKDESPVDGQRTLNWDLEVGEDALKEMMETLGPPGMLLAII